MKIEFYNKETGEVVDPYPDYEMLVVDYDQEVICISFNSFGDLIGDLIVKSDLDWRVVEEVK